MSLVHVPERNLPPHQAHFDLAPTSILTYPFPVEAYYCTAAGTVVDPDLATTLWTQLKLITAQATITEDVRTFCTVRGMPQPPPLFSFQFAPSINLLRVVFPSQASARTAVETAQNEGRAALGWLLHFCEELRVVANDHGYELPYHPPALLDYYRSITLPGWLAPHNPCRDVVPYRPAFQFPQDAPAPSTSLAPFMHDRPQAAHSTPLTTTASRDPRVGHPGGQPTTPAHATADGSHGKIGRAHV